MRYSHVDDCSGIERLPKTLAAILKSLQKETGWAFTILAGGPSPRNEGKIMTYMFVIGF